MSPNKLNSIGLIAALIIISISSVTAEVNEDQIVTLIHGRLNDLPYQYYQVIDLGVQEGDTLKVSVEVLDSGMPVDIFLESFRYQQTGPYTGEAKWTFLSDTAYYGITKKTFSKEINDENRYHLVIGSSNAGRVRLIITASSENSGSSGGSGSGESSGQNTGGFEAYLVIFALVLLTIWKK